MGEVRKLENGPRRQSTNECEEVKIAFYGDARGGPCDHKEVLQAMGCRRP